MTLLVPYEGTEARWATLVRWIQLRVCRNVVDIRASKPKTISERKELTEETEKSSQISKKSIKSSEKNSNKESKNDNPKSSPVPNYIEKEDTEDEKALVVVNLASDSTTQMILKEHISVSKLPAFGQIRTTALAAGSVIYAYSAHGVVLPLENKMRKPEDMLGFFGVISISNFLIGFLYGTTGLLGYITYGENLKGSITLNLTNSPYVFQKKKRAQP
ncbi:hypothetical protein NECAME_12489 [Necator americanus]|uniref:Amino acid transporter transmembrane domain-containing protein n=1 Tax=Necator americanus TaxID=51031 RepID=W2T179_NECAM|nr:hypothetical protein NECAME_12489 [Necator americanus]ETN75299.1 hypothetical protein NECAME_12489 [Necator americanus]